MSSETAKEAVLLERYKYILDQKKNLNERTFKIASVYQVLVLAIVTGQFSIVSDERSGRLDQQIAIDASWGLFILLAIVTFILFALIIGGILAWLGYRKDEIDIEMLVRGVSRNEPKLRDIFKWYETYILLAGMIGLGFYSYAIIWKIIPTILMK